QGPRSRRPRSFSPKSMSNNLETKIRTLAKTDGRYAFDAYRFVYEALDYTVRNLERKGHVTGRQLLEGIRDLALEQFGGLAPVVFKSWGITRTCDFGNIVFNLVGAQLMSRSDSDCIEDFNDVYDFRDAFRIDACPRKTKAE